MEHMNTSPVRRRRYATIARLCGMVAVCLAGTVACLNDANDRVADDARTRRAVQLPSTTPERPRDVRAAAAQAAPAPATPTLVPTAAPSPTSAPAAASPTLAPATPASSTPASAAQPPSQPSAGRVVYAGEDGLNLRSAPNQQKIAALLAGSNVAIRGAARDEGGFRWWPVAVAAGWMVEGPRDAAQGRWLVPVDAERIEPNRPARVAYAGKDGLNLRSEPGPDGPISATLLEGSLVTVVGGPVQVNGATWWQVQVAEGWLAEGKADGSGPRWMALES